MITRRTRGRRTSVTCAALLLVSFGVGTAAAGEPEPEKATGEPIVLGLINTENIPQGDFSELRLAAEAAVKFVNRERGGVDGRPLKIESCVTGLTPEQSAACADELLEKDPVAFVGGADFGAFGSVPLLDAAGIPVLGGALFVPPQQQSPTTFGFVGFFGGPALVKYAKDELDADKINLLMPDTVAGRAVTATQLKPALEAAGYSDVVEQYWATNTADFTADVTAVTRDDPDAVLVIATARECPLVMQTWKTLGIQAELLLIGANCSEPGILEAAGENAEGAYFAPDYLNLASPKNKEVKLYKKKLKQYSSEQVIQTSFTPAGFSSIMNIEALFESVGADNLSPESILAAVRATNETPNFMAHPYTCNGEAIPGFPAFCNSFVRIVQYEDGELVDVGDGWVTAADLLPAPTGS